MTRYKFSQDRKHTIWIRTHFTIDAPTQAEAIAKAATLVGQDVEDAEAEDERISIEESETLYDTMDEIPVEDNDGNSTIDIIFDNGDDLADNVTGAVWDYWWKESDDEVLESITGLRRSDFDSEDGGRTFAAACEEWWNKHSELEKIEIWIQQTAAAQRYCPHCGRRLSGSHVGDYAFQCKYCDEDFYSSEVLTSPSTQPSEPTE